MSESNHTPGPWTLGHIVTSKVDGFSVKGFPISANGQSIARVWAGVPGREGFGIENLSANATLIAAAPDLAEALLLCLEHGDMGPEGIGGRAAIAALAKAFGTKK